MILALANPCESPFAKSCKSLQNHWAMNFESLQILAKHCKPYLQFCVKACETKVFLQKHICKSLQKWMHFAIANLTKTQFAKPCERCSGLASFSKILQGFASGLLQGYHWAMNLKACKSLLNTANHTCNFALKLVKPKYFCKSIFAKACKNRCIVQLQILTKNTFCKTL